VLKNNLPEAKFVRNHRHRTPIVVYPAAEGQYFFPNFSKFNVNYETVRDSLDYYGNAGSAPQNRNTDDRQRQLFGGGTLRCWCRWHHQENLSESRAPRCSTTGRDLTKMAEVTSRPYRGPRKEIERVAPDLSRRKRITHPHQAWRGKTAIARPSPCASSEKKVSRVFSTSAW
jgi:ATP-dependent Clp protease ATP-binding subunit ClpC